MTGARDWLRQLRVRQWTKNLFVFVGVLFGSHWSGHEIGDALIAFASFCMASSASYQMNDVMDVQNDRIHPEKRHRPLASGRVRVSHAIAAGGLLALASVLIAASLGAAAVAIVTAYLVINVAYSRVLKRVVLIDVFCIAIGFMLRLLMGTSGIGLPPSAWLVICGLFLTLTLGFGKRRAEIGAIDGGAAGSTGSVAQRPVLAHYDRTSLDQLLAITSACTIIAYAIYTVSFGWGGAPSRERLVWTVPFVVYGMLRYLLMVNRHGKGADPSEDLLQDRQLLATAALWVVSVVVLLGAG